MPSHWKRYRSFDYGLDMFCCLWWAVDEDGRAWCYREYARKGLIVQEAAAIMREHTLPGENIITTYAPPDMWSRQKDTGRTMAELFMQNGIGITRSDNNRVQGHMVMKEMLAPIPLKDRYLVAMYGNDENGKPKAPDKVPAMVFFKGCKGIIEDIQEIQHDENNPNDCAKEPHEITHSVDACRYFAINRKLPAEIIAESPTNKYNDWLASLDGGSASKEDYNSYMCGGEPSRAYIGVA
jgi:phage terminase large subunit